jgi:hypothetical protein
MKHQSRQVVIKQVLQKFAEVNGKVVEVFIGATDSCFKKGCFTILFYFALFLIK